MIDNLTYRVMNEIGLDVDLENRIIDQDTGRIFRFKEKVCKATFDTNNSAIPIDPQEEIYFEPLLDSRQMQALFFYYLNKLKIEEDIEFNVSYETSTIGDDGIPRRGVGVSSTEKTFESGQYLSDSLRYADLILKVNGGPDNYTEFSILDPVVYQLVVQRKMDRQLENSSR